MDRNMFGGLMTGLALGFLVALLSAPEEGYLFRYRFFNFLTEKIPSLPFLTHDQPTIIEEELH
jgi:gas vesicle protein